MLSRAEYVANTLGLVIATGATVIDATTGTADNDGNADWQQISFNTQWNDPYSGMSISIDSTSPADVTAGIPASITFTVRSQAICCCLRTLRMC